MIVQVGPKSPSHMIQMIIPKFIIVKWSNTFGEVVWAYGFSIYKSWCIFLNFIYLFSEGEGREKEKERNITHPQPGTWPAPQACAASGNQTSDLSVHRLPRSPLSHSNQGYTSFYWKVLKTGGIENVFTQKVQFVIAKRWKNPNVPQLMNEQNVI